MISLRAHNSQPYQPHCTRGEVVTRGACYLPLGIMIRVALLAALLSSVLAGGAVASSPPFRNWTLPREVRVADLVSRLTLEEKFSLMSSNNAAVPRLGVDAFKYGCSVPRRIQTP